MRLVVGLLVVAGIALAGSAARGQAPTGGEFPQGPQAPPARQLPAPFALTPPEQQQLDNVLAFWEKSSKSVTRFSCKFYRLRYDRESASAAVQYRLSPDDEGKLWFQAPDKAAFKIDKGPAEHWICDGASVFFYNFRDKVITEYKLPPEMRGRAITDGPLPFVFGTTAEQLRRRYWLRIFTPQQAQGEVWLEAFPRSFEDSRNFRKAEVILALNAPRDALLPIAVRIFEPNQNKWTVFQFVDMEVNQRKPWIDLFGSDPFSPKRPGFDWRFEVANQQEAAPAQRPGPQSVPPSVGRRPGFSRQQ